MRKKFKFFVLILLKSIIFNLLASGLMVSRPKNSFISSALKENFSSFNFQKPYFFSLQEAPIDLDRPFLLIFFNISCQVCWDALFVWKEFVESRQIPVQLVGVTRDPEEAVSHFLRKYALTIPVIIDRQSQLFRLYRVRLEPFLLLGRGQEIIYKDNLMEPVTRRREKLEQCLLALR